MEDNCLNFTAFFDETGSVTNDTSEIFGGSLFVIDNSEIDKCRDFLKKKYPNGIHCKNIRNKQTLLNISKEVGKFLNHKKCCAVTKIQTNEKFIPDYKKLVKKCENFPEFLGMKKFLNYTYIPRYILFSIYSLSQISIRKNITVEIFTENVVRDKSKDHWDIHIQGFKDSLKTYKKFIPNIQSFLQYNNIKYIGPTDKTKKEEIMFSFPDLFAYAIRRILTHGEDDLYNNLKPVFDRFPFGSKEFSGHFTPVPKGIMLTHIDAQEFIQIAGLNQGQWDEELQKLSQNKPLNHN